MNPIFEGLGVAMITPFGADGSIHYPAAARIIEHLITNGTKAIVVLGTTGEPPTMNDAEKEAMIRFTVETVNRRVPVIAGCGCNCTADTVVSARKAEALGADALLVVTPYYNKCTQDGLVAHYRAVSDAVNIPIVAYNVPARTGVNILPKTVLRLADIEHVAALKEATNNVEQLQEILALAGDKIDVYLGDDHLTYPGMMLGAKGVISVAGNAIPNIMSELCGQVLSGNYTEARRMHMRLIRLYKAMFLEVNPIPVKWAINYLGFDAGDPRLPLTPLTPANAQELRAALDEIKETL